MFLQKKRSVVRYRQLSQTSWPTFFFKLRELKFSSRLSPISQLQCNTPIPNSLIMQKLEWHHISVAKKHQIQTRWVLLCWYSNFRIHWKRRSVFFNMEKLRSNPYKKNACPTWPRFQEIVNFQTLIKSDQNMISFWECVFLNSCF